MAPPHLPVALMRFLPHLGKIYSREPLASMRPHTYALPTPLLAHARSIRVRLQSLPFRCQYQRPPSA